MKGLNFLLSSFVITSILSIFTGTAVGTLSTIGVVFLGVGQGFGVPEHITLGAIISGAFVADKLSPLSGLLNLTLTATQKRYREVIGVMLITMTPTFLITAVVYSIIGRGYVASGDSSQLEYYRQSIEQGFKVSPFLLILPIIIVGLCLFGVKTIKTISLGLGVGVIISLAVQGMDLSQVLRSIIFGYRASTPSTELNNILLSGGAISMVEIVLIVMGAIALSSLFEAMGIITSLISKLILKVKTKRELIITTGFISSLLTMLTCDQTVGIVLPGKMLRDKYREMEIDTSILARTISDTGTIIAPLMPWNVNAIIIGMISGVSALSYGPYAVLCYVAPLVTIALAYKSNGGSRVLLENKAA
jgi:Na+:H+ antiporter, NhaC family